MLAAGTCRIAPALAPRATARALNFQRPLSSSSPLTLIKLLASSRQGMLCFEPYRDR
jgi:hypothetical protein